MIKNFNINNIQCQFQNHQERKINAICFHKDCREMRFCCVQCISQFHYAHPKDFIEIDFLQTLLKEMSNEEVIYSQSYTYGQRQVIQNLEELLIQIDYLQNIIKQEIQKVKQSNLQQYLKEWSNDQQGIEYWNKQIEGLLQYFEVENNFLIKKNQEQCQISELEQKSILIIDSSRDSLKQIIKQFDKPPKDQQFKFKSDPIELEGHTNDLWGVVISSDGAIIASGSDDNTVNLWNAKTKQLLQTFKYNSSVYEVAISSNNQYLAYGGSGNYSLQLQDLQSNHPQGTLKGHTSCIRSIVFSYDSQFIFSGGDDNKLIIWNLRSKTQISSFKTDSSVNTIVASPDNKIISCICDKSINIWDFQTKIQLIYQQELISEGCGLCSSKDSSTFISSGDDGFIRFWRLNDGDDNLKYLTLTREIKVADRVIWKVILTSDEKYIISICNEEKKIMIHGIESGNLIQELEFEIGTFYYGYISISSDMKYIVSGNNGDKVVRIWTRE